MKQLEDILKKIALKKTDNRRNAIIEILKENNIKYKIQTIIKECPLYISNCSYLDEINDFNEEKLTFTTKYYYNIIVDINNTFNTNKDKILLTAHYDVVNNSTGANDNGSSIAILLKLIINYNNTNLPIRIAFLDGEEIGGVGSKGYIDEYIKEDSLKKEITVINFDVCGCGDYIVLEDKRLNKNLLNEEILTKYNIKITKRLPFNDAHIFSQNNISTLCIVVLPQGDINLMEKKSNESLLEKKHFGSYVWQYQHNGIYDSIDYINYQMMEKVYKYICELLFLSI